MSENNVQPIATAVDDQTCPGVAHQSISVSVPVTVTPFAQAGGTVTKCCGKSTVAAGAYTGEGARNGSCAFTISQDLCVAIPVAFGATAATGDTYVTCNEVSADDICTDCDIPTPPPAAMAEETATFEDQSKAESTES